MTSSCPRCNGTNRATARFCAHCALPLIQKCATCGINAALTARFCPQCGNAFTNFTHPEINISPPTGRLTGNSLLAERYLIVKKVGQGGMGAVYQAKDRRLGDRVVAIKEMSEVALTTVLQKQQARLAFQQEAQMLAELTHLNLPRVTDHFSHASKQYLVMDFIEGDSLLQLLQLAAGKPLEIKKVVAWAKQLCDVLDYLHNQTTAIVFRDLKPANIMIDRSGQVKLIDFGIARFFKRGQSVDTIYFGTVGYAAPEQYGGKGQTDARADIYALGATLHHLLTGYEPDQSPFNLPTVQQLNPEVPKTLSDTIMRALQHEPSERWQTVREMKDALLSENPTRPQGVILSKSAVSAKPSPIVPPYASPKVADLQPTQTNLPENKPKREKHAKVKKKIHNPITSLEPPMAAPLIVMPPISPQAPVERRQNSWWYPRLPRPRLPKLTLKWWRIITFAIIGGLIGRWVAALEARAHIEEFVFTGFLAGAFFGLVGWGGFFGGLIGAAIAQEIYVDLAQGLGIGIMVGILLGKRGWATIIGAVIGAGLGYLYAPVLEIAFIGALIGALLAFRTIK